MGVAASTPGIEIPYAFVDSVVVYQARGTTRRATGRDMHCHSTGATHPITYRLTVS
jgi:hypothetical protein